MGFKEVLGMALTNTDFRRQLMEDPESILKNHDVDLSTLNKIRGLAKESLESIAFNSSNDFSTLALIDRR